MSNLPRKWPQRLRQQCSRPFQWLAWVWSRMPAAEIPSPQSNSNLEQLARNSVRVYLEALHKRREPVTALNYDEAVRRADYAASFVQHPYWEIVSRMLSGTIQNETEQALASDEHIAMNRASVAMCRKVLQMPFFDIEQGRLEDSEYRKAQARLSKRRYNQGGPTPPQVQ